MCIEVLKHVHPLPRAILLVMDVFVDPIVDTATNDATMQNPLHAISVGDIPRDRIHLVEIRVLNFFRTHPRM